MILYASEKEMKEKTHKLSQKENYASMMVEVEESDLPQWVRCGMAAIGADFLFSAGVEGGSKHNKWTKKALIKLIGKVGSRMLGPIGTAIAIATFIGCMW